MRGPIIHIFSNIWTTNSSSDFTNWSTWPWPFVILLQGSLRNYIPIWHWMLVVFSRSIQDAIVFDYHESHCFKWNGTICLNMGLTGPWYSDVYTRIIILTRSVLVYWQSQEFQPLYFLWGTPVATVFDRISISLIRLNSIVHTRAILYLFTDAQWRKYVSYHWFIIGSDYGLSPLQFKDNAWTNAVYCQLDHWKQI